MKIISMPIDDKPLIIDLRGQKIEIHIFKTDEKDNVKIGIKAPRNVSVHREEIAKQIKQKGAQL